MGKLLTSVSADTLQPVCTMTGREQGICVLPAGTKQLHIRPCCGLHYAAPQRDMVCIQRHHIVQNAILFHLQQLSAG